MTDVRTEMLSSEELARYSRHLALPQVGREGQERLRAASVLLIGAGGLGSPLALYLAAAGIGRIGLVDDDRVDVTNLQRQVLYTSTDIGHNKVEAAAERLRALNPHVRIEAHPVRFSSQNALKLVRSYDVVADGSDNFGTRYLVNDACVLAERPNVYGSIFRFEGQVSVFEAGRGPCYRCLYAHPPPPDLVPSCAEGGVLGVLPGIVGALQAAEVLKLVLGIGEPLIGRLLLIDAAGADFRTLAIQKDPDCPICGATPSILDLTEADTLCRPPLPPMDTLSPVREITVRELHEMIERGERPFLLDVRRPEETEIASLGGTLIPLDELPRRVQEIAEHRSDEPLVVYCRSGARSARAVRILQEAGFEHPVNLKGGVLAWSDEIDPSMQKY